MQFTLSPLHTLKTIQEMEPAFHDIQAYLQTIQPPKYPFAIDAGKAARGQKIFTEQCSKCHGIYGEKWTYPNKLIDLEEIGTDPNRAEGISSRAKAHYDRTWFGQECGPDGKRLVTSNEPGYIAPPLDGIWATAPYLHNGSVPTLYTLLNSPTRPKRFTRSYQTGTEDYDATKVGWKYRAVEENLSPSLPPLERRKVYDTSQPGRGNGGHTFGDGLTDAERWALIEYLKTL
jgi:mono/diheme cytochrome c family protein